MFAPEKGRENPEIRQALALCEGAGIAVIFHEDTVEVRYGLNNKRFYMVWSQFLADARALFGERLDEPEPGRLAEQFSPPPPPPQRKAPPLPPAEQIRALRAEVRLLERAVKVVGMQSEEWKNEAERLARELEATRTDIRQVAEARAALVGGDRYKQVRQIIVRRLHPDVFGTDEEKRVREKLFKTIWSEIEQLDRA